MITRNGLTRLVMSIALVAILLHPSCSCGPSISLRKSDWPIDLFSGAQYATTTIACSRDFTERFIYDYLREKSFVINKRNTELIQAERSYKGALYKMGYRGKSRWVESTSIQVYLSGTDTSSTFVVLTDSIEAPDEDFAKSGWRRRESPSTDCDCSDLYSKLLGLKYECGSGSLNP